MISYGERGLGINLEPLPSLARLIAELPEVRAARWIGVADELGGMAALLSSEFEDPHLIPSDETPLLAVEPATHFPGGVGAGVENLFIVTPDGGVELREAFGAR